MTTSPICHRNGTTRFDVWADAYISPFDDLVHATANRNWDSDFRLQELDADGISAEILFPNTIPPFFETVTNIAIGLPITQEDFDRRWAGLQAHNRWMVDFVSLAPKRRRGLVQIFPNDVDAAVAELRWARETGAFGGLLLPAVPPGHAVEPLFHTRREPLWGAWRAELNTPDGPSCRHRQPTDADGPAGVTGGSHQRNGGVAAAHPDPPDSGWGLRALPRHPVRPYRTRHRLGA